MPLLYATPPEWALRVLQTPLDLLNDHAWLEKKAANNALDMLHQWPRADMATRWTTVMASIAKDEVQHLALVCRHLTRMGGQLTRSHRCAYATELHTTVRRGAGPLQTMDRLLVAALIEARSCERFGILATACTDVDLRKLYQGLVGSEAGHYQAFLRLAAATHPTWSTRWHELLASEADAIAHQPPGPGMHTGV